MTPKPLKNHQVQWPDSKKVVNDDSKRAAKPSKNHWCQWFMRKKHYHPIAPEKWPLLTSRYKGILGWGRKRHVCLGWKVLGGFPVLSNPVSHVKLHRGPWVRGWKGVQNWPRDTKPKKISNSIFIINISCQFLSSTFLHKFPGLQMNTLKFIIPTLPSPSFIS